MYTEVYERNRQIQNICADIVLSVYQQKYNVVLGLMTRLSKEMSAFLGSFENLDNEQVKNEYNLIVASLYEINRAIECEDYIILADLLELKIMPCLLRMQDVFRQYTDNLTDVTIFNYNIEKLHRRDQILAEKCRENWKQKGNDQFWMESTNSGWETLASKDNKGVYYYHSNNNPYREAKLFAERYFSAFSHRYLILGLGLGYHCQMLAGIHDGAEIIIFEPSIGVITQAMKTTKMDWLWNNEHIQLVYDDNVWLLSQKLQQYSEEISNGRTVFVIHAPSIRHIKNTRVQQKMKQLLTRDNNIRLLEAQMQINFEKNIQNCSRNVDTLKSAFCGKKVIIVAAGPSLDGNISELKECPEDTVILAVGTVFSKLLQLGIRVDYVIVSDPKHWTANQFIDNFGSTVPMIVLSTAYYKIAERYYGEKYLVCQKEYKQAEQYAIQNNCKLYRTGGSVVTIALDICLNMQCKEIAFIGLDLAFTNGYVHAVNTLAERARSYNDNYEVDGYEMTSKGLQHIKLYSCQSFVMYREWIEERIKEYNGNAHIYDASEGGAVIKGMEIILLNDYLNKK